MSRKYNIFCYGRQELLLLPSGLQNPKKTLDNPYTHMITSVMLARQITLPHPPNQANSFAPALLQPLSSLFAAPLLCFQQLAASFRKTPGVGVRARKSRHSHFQPFPRSGAATPFLPITFMRLRTLLRNGNPISLLFPILCALFLSPRGWYPFDLVMAVAAGEFADDVADRSFLRRR